MGVKYYTGVGSRQTPNEYGEVIYKIASKLSDLGFVLRSGGADGADTFFENGSKDSVIYLPWIGYNGRKGRVPEDHQLAYDLLENVHPYYHSLSDGAIKLHLRNINQVLGDDLDNIIKSNFLICYARIDTKGVPIGGTRTAWLIAKMYDIPCFNLFIKRDYERLIKFI